MPSTDDLTDAGVPRHVHEELRVLSGASAVAGFLSVLIATIVIGVIGLGMLKSMVGTALAIAVAVPLCYFLLVRFEEKRPCMELGYPRMSTRVLLIVLAIGISELIILFAATGLAGVALKMEFVGLQIEDADKSVVLSIAMSALIVAPILEEVLFRGLLLPWLLVRF